MYHIMDSASWRLARIVEITQLHSVFPVTWSPAVAETLIIIWRETNRMIPLTGVPELWHARWNFSVWQRKKNTGASFILTSNMCGQWAWMDVAGLQEGGVQESKWRRGGVWREFMWGYGDGQLSSIPQGTACYAKQNQSFSKKPELICQPQQTLSISTGLTLQPPPTIGAFLFVHWGVEVCKAQLGVTEQAPLSVNQVLLLLFASHGSVPH